MATRVCPECGAQYVASVRRCIDCDVVLVDQEPEAVGDALVVAAPVGDGDRVAYELEHWGNQLKVSLEGMLDKAGIRRVWEVGALVVSAEDAEAVESLIETVEGRDVEDLQEMEEQLAFEIEGLDAEGAAELDAQLIAAGVAHAWSEEGDLLVALADEERVSAIIDAVLEGDIEDEGDGLAANQALSDLYVVLDRLVKAPTDHKLIKRLGEAAATLEPFGVPYGFAAQEWNDLKAEVAALLAMAEGDTAVGEPGDGGDDAEDDEAADPVDAGESDVDDGDAEDGAEELSDEERFVERAAQLREQLLTWV
jgi:hypothetical protein